MAIKLLTFFLVISLTIFGLFYWSFQATISQINNFLPAPSPTITTLVVNPTPTAIITTSPIIKKTVTPSILLSKPTTKPTVVSDSDPWGVAKQISEHTWTMKIKNDPVMGSPAEILEALNQYRRRFGSQPLAFDQKLTEYAQSRANYFYEIKNLDSHRGFLDFLSKDNGYEKLGYGWLGENASYGYVLSGVHLIEWIFAGDKPHDDNQRDSKWDHVGIGIKGSAVCLIFATSKL